MYMCVKNAALYCAAKVDGAFRRVFKEQSGGAEIIATLIIIAVVLVLALAFREKLLGMVKDLWNQMVVDGDVSTQPEFSEWE